MKRILQISILIFGGLLFYSCAGDENEPKDKGAEKEPKEIKKGSLSQLDPEVEKKNTVDLVEIDSVSTKEDSILKIRATPELKLYLFEKNGLYGYKDEHNIVVLEAQYQMANDFVNGMAEVVDEEGWAYINGRGEVLARPFIYDNGPDYFREGLARFVENDKIGFLDEKGTKKIKAKFDFAHPFHDGLAAACQGCEEQTFTTESGSHIQMIGGKWGFIDKKGEWVIPCEYEAVQDFENGVGACQKDGQWVKIKPNGDTL